MPPKQIETKPRPTLQELLAAGYTVGEIVSGDAPDYLPEPQQTPKKPTP